MRDSRESRCPRRSRPLSQATAVALTIALSLALMMASANASQALAADERSAQDAGDSTALGIAEGGGSKGAGATDWANALAGAVGASGENAATAAGANASDWKNVADAVGANAAIAAGANASDWANAAGASGISAGNTSALTPGIIPGIGMPGTSPIGALPEYVYGSASSKSGFISVSGRKSGAASYNPKTKTLTLNKVVCENGNLTIGISAKAIKIKLKGANTIQDVSSNSSLTFVGPGALVGDVNANSLKTTGVKVASGTIKGTIACGAAYRMAGGTVKGDVASGANVKIVGGAVKGDVMVGTSFAMSGGTVKGRVFAYNGAAKMTGGTINGTLSTHKKLTMAGGRIVRNGGTGYSVICYGLYMTKGTISIKNCTYGVSVHGNRGVARNFKMTGGKVVVTATEYAGISVSGGNLVQAGGTISVKGAKRDAISVSAARYDGKSYGGRAQIKGGTFKAIATNPSSRYALSAQSVSNKLSAVKAIKGRIPQGMLFKRGGNQYKVMGPSILGGGNVKLVQYGSSKRKAVVNKVSFGGNAYNVQGIAQDAFNAKAGSRLTSIVVASNVREIGANAFANTKSLNVLRFDNIGWMQRSYDLGLSFQLKSVTVSNGCTVSAKAFTKCGKDDGRFLTVALGKTGVPAREAPAYKRFLLKHGLPRAAKLRVHA